MFTELQYFAPYFNDTSALRDAYQKLYPDYSYDMISTLMVGVLSVYVPDEKFNDLVDRVVSEANAKVNN